ncbi:MAG: hypothetical protein K6D94_09670 [Clostridiales bacterium]|nr:hypothetical protein [Clostridiales bacterium]
MDDRIMEPLRDERYLKNQNAWFEKLKDLFDGGYDGPIVLNGVSSWNVTLDADDIPTYEDLRKTLELDLLSLSGRMESTLSEDQFRPACIEQGFFGVHFTDRIFGSEVFFNPDSLQWYNKYLKAEVGGLEPPDLENNRTWNLAREYAQMFFAMDTTVPLFGLPTIASVLNIAINLYGQEILVAMMTDPEAARHDLKIINDALISMHRWYLDNFPMERLQPVVSFSRTQPPGYGQLCGCSTQLISPKLYEEFIMPLDDELLAAYPHGGMIHLCGAHAHLIPLFASMPHLRSVQINDRAAADLELYVKGLRKDQVIYLNPCPEMPLETGLEIAKGRKMVVCGDYRL